MKAWIANEYETLTEKLAALKAAEKTGTVTYRESLGRKCYYKGILEIYEKFGL